MSKSTTASVATEVGLAAVYVASVFIIPKVAKKLWKAGSSLKPAIVSKVKP